MNGTRSRFTTKPVVSLAAIGSFPMARAKAKAASNTAGAVPTVRTTSTSGIRGTGLKKWRPTKRSRRRVTAAIAAMVRLEVFDAKMVPGGAS